MVVSEHAEGGQERWRRTGERQATDGLAHGASCGECVHLNCARYAEWSLLDDIAPRGRSGPS